VSVPDAAKDDKVNGRRLFIEKGCLGCHVNNGTAQNGVRALRQR
jgi:mono/diheme cytochrome c family protein